MSYRTDKLMIDGHTDTHTYTHTHAGNDNTRRPKLASGKKHYLSMLCHMLCVDAFSCPKLITGYRWFSSHDLICLTNSGSKADIASWFTQQIKFPFITLYPPYQTKIFASINMGTIYTSSLWLNLCNTADKLEKNSNVPGSHNLWISCMKLTNYFVLLNIRLVIILPHPNMTPDLFVPINLCVAMARHCTDLSNVFTWNVLKLDMGRKNLK